MKFSLHRRSRTVHGAFLKTFLRITKLIALILTTACLQVSAFTYGQTITLSVHDATLENVFNKIKAQSEYRFWYESKLLNQTKKVTIEVKKASIKQVMNLCLANQPLTYNIIKKVIVIKPKNTTPDIILPTSPPKDTLHGKIINEHGGSVPGATIRLKGTQIATISDDNGNFTLSNAPDNATLIISSIGYEPKEYTLTGSNNHFSIRLAASVAHLDSLAVTISTGYQELPKARATGSFDFIDNKLLNRSVSTNILDRLDGVASGLIFNKNLQNFHNNSDITIRGRSTIFANPNPLIVVDNFEYDGDITNINPNDVESITILKDAAAASIWGVRAGNGVIVITTKKGKYNKKPTINVNSNITIGGKPDLWYPYQMTSGEYIELESYLFDKGYYDYTLSNDYQAISPAVALMQQRRTGQITDKEYENKINQLKQYDVRNDLYKYFYRTKVYQQYQINFSGGDANQKYFISAGYDKNLENDVNKMYRRITVNANNTMNFWDNKVTLFTGMTFTNSKTGTNSKAFYPYTPYDHVADNNGNALPVVDNVLQTFRESYVDTAGDGKLLDWIYRPLNGRGPNRISKLNDYRLNVSLTIRPIKHFGVNINYQYQRGIGNLTEYNDVNSFYTRDMINRYSQIDRQTGNVSRVIPVGDIVSKDRSDYTSQTGRVQMNYNNSFENGSELNLLAGFEAKQYTTDRFSNTLYGYNPDNETNENGTINPNQYYPLYFTPYQMGKISTSPGQLGTIDNYRSWYANGSFAYLGRYIISASVRRDESNIFGVKPNQKGVPLWSAGLAWTITDEDFFKIPFISFLKLRGSYGYNGNVDKSTSAFLTTISFGQNYWGRRASIVKNPPNPSLRWEKVKNINIGVDYSLFENSIAGSIEYYMKNGSDLIGNSPIAPQTGLSLFRGNTADMKTKGIDFEAKFKLIDRRFKWTTNLLYSYVRNKVTRYRAEQAYNFEIVSGNDTNPLEGYPYYAVFAFRWGGLDEQGKPQGYLNGKLSKDYAAIINSDNNKELVFKGSGTPTSFGSLRNRISYKGFGISFDIVYKLGYYFREGNIFNGSSYNYHQKGFSDRWKKSGDEINTSIPRLTYPQNTQMGIYFSESLLNVERGDHVRLQDIRLAYSFPRFNNISALTIYCYIRNIGVLWKQNKKGLDPDYNSMLIPIPTSYSIGLNLNF